MGWDINSFLQQLTGGFEAGQEKRDLAMKDQSIQMQDEMKAAELEDKKKKTDELHQFKIQKEQLSLIQKIAKLFEPKQEKPVEGQPAPTPTPNPIIEQLKKGLEAGFTNYSAKSGYENPLATMSAEMAQGAVDNNLPDPYLPATMNLMETGGSKHMASENNYFNYGANAKPDINTAIDRINEGIGNTGEKGLYKDYLQSGDMQDFFKRYTPSADPRNPNYDELMKRYTQLRGYFPK